MGAPTPPGEELGERYLWYLDGGRQALVDALTLVAEPANLPLVFHCAAGRTAPACWPRWCSTSWAWTPS